VLLDDITIEVSSAYRVGKQSCPKPLGRSLMYKIERTGPKTDP